MTCLATRPDRSGGRVRGEQVAGGRNPERGDHQQGYQPGRNPGYVGAQAPHPNLMTIPSLQPVWMSANRFNGCRAGHVCSNVIRLILALSVVLPVFAADSDLSHVLKAVEERYNHAKTLQVGFDESYSVEGRSGRPESGQLSLRKPGKMRWEYRTPAGKLFISNGKDVYYYTPANNRVEKMKLKESEDMRAPLAFLLGQLEFERDFRNFRQKAGENGATVINATPKSDRLPYKEVQFVVTPSYEIRKLDVVGHDDSVLTFVFTNERLNPSLDERLFKFEMPKGAVLVDSSQQESK